MTVNTNISIIILSINELHDPINGNSFRTGLKRIQLYASYKKHGLYI